MKKEKVFSNLVWRFFERAGAQGVSLIVSIILARLLDPNVYGTVALITVFTAILQVFVDSGLGNALILKKDADNVDFSTVFYFNIIVCTVLYAGMFLFAPIIANFYNRPELTNVVRVLSLTLVISGLKNVQQAYVSRHMMFKRFFFATLGGTIGAAVIGIYMAYKGFGVWAIVVQHLFNLAVDTIILWITVKWRPDPVFSWERLKVLFSFGWKLLASSLIDNVYNNLRQLIIGKMYSADSLAFYNRGKQFPNVFVTNINTSIDSVLLPAMSREQDNKDNIRAMTRRSIKTSSYVMAPLMMGLAFVGEPFISLVLTDKWLPCVFFLRIFCVTFMFQPLHTANLNAIKAMGRSDLFLKLDIYKRVIGITLLLISMWISVEAMAYSLLIGSVASQLINSWPNKKLLGYSYSDQIKDIFPSIGLAVLMGVIIYPVQYLNISKLLILVIQFFCGAVFYLGCSKLFKMESYSYITQLAKSYLKHKIK